VLKAQDVHARGKRGAFRDLDAGRYGKIEMQAAIVAPSPHRPGRRQCAMLGQETVPAGESVMTWVHIDDEAFMGNDMANVGIGPALPPALEGVGIGRRLGFPACDGWLFRASVERNDAKAKLGQFQNICTGSFSFPVQSR
jgi:hypothetical protein